MHQCPKCQSRDIHRSRITSTCEAWRKGMTSKRPFRCRACNWRGWGVDAGPARSVKDLELATRAVARRPPALVTAGEDDRDFDLKKLD